MAISSYDSLYAISDIHLGGEKGFQIFNQGERLAKTINNIASTADKPTAFVLNGDIVDFLAEAPAMHLDPLGAIDKLERIMADPSFSMVWQALSNLLDNEYCHLILVLGNHDVELGLPQVQQWLKTKLARNDAARGRLQFCFDGTGFSCTVGNKRVLCVHGNEVDSWNVVDHLALIQLSRAINRGMQVPEWDANAGTRLVIGVMNEIKKKYPMVDLLKPEDKAAVPTILALGPDVEALELTAKLARITAKRAKDKIRLETGFLAAEDELGSDEAILDKPIYDELEKLLSNTQLKADRDNSLGDDLLRNAFDRFENEPYGHESRVELHGDELLGVADWFARYFGEESTANRLRKVLGWLLDSDPTFDIKHKDSTYEELNEIVGNDIDYLLAGHTHLRRAIPRKGGYYYNSGTWIRLIRLTQNVLDNEEEFQKTFSALSKNIEVLDRHKIPGPRGNQSLVLLQPTVVCITQDDNETTYGCLCEAKTNGELKEIKNTRYPGGSS